LIVSAREAKVRAKEGRVDSRLRGNDIVTARHAPTRRT
jgi:hypothetical protein